jgi:TRIAP1/MDM35 family protein
MADSLSASCTPLRRSYDVCFNRWLEGYLNVANPKNAEAPVQSDEKLKALKAQADLYEEQCGATFREYQQCLQVRISRLFVAQCPHERRSVSKRRASRRSSRPPGPRSPCYDLTTRSTLASDDDRLQHSTIKCTSPHAALHHLHGEPPFSSSSFIGRSDLDVSVRLASLDALEYNTRPTCTIHPRQATTSVACGTLKPSHTRPRPNRTPRGTT